MFFDVKNLMKVGESPLRGFPTKRQSLSGGGSMAGRHCGPGGSRQSSPDRLREHCCASEGFRPGADAAHIRGSAAALKRRGGRTRLRLPDEHFSNRLRLRREGVVPEGFHRLKDVAACCSAQRAGRREAGLRFGRTAHAITASLGWNGVLRTLERNKAHGRIECHVTGNGGVARRTR
jgi:hypothetical protein